MRFSRPWCETDLSNSAVTLEPQNKVALIRCAREIAAAASNKIIEANDTKPFVKQASNKWLPMKPAARLRAIVR